MQRSQAAYEQKVAEEKAALAEREKALTEEAAELKRARIANGAEPGYKNGEPYDNQ